MSFYPALDVGGVDPDLALAAVDDWSPVAAESSGPVITIFFSSAPQRDEAARALGIALPKATVSSRDVDDEDWARRSQEGLSSIVVGRLTIHPNPAPLSIAPLSPDLPRPDSLSPDDRPPVPSLQSLEVVIHPSMGFGTGHHATTRLCLVALQQIDVSDRFVLDVGTGSGVLALAARALGARRALGVDYDPDAIQSARENLPLNPGLTRTGAVVFEVLDLDHLPLPSADVVTANLTGALLGRAASLLAASVAPRGTLIVSGVLNTERDAVVAAFSMLELVWEAHEGEWVGLRFDRPIHDKV